MFVDTVLMMHSARQHSLAEDQADSAPVVPVVPDPLPAPTATINAEEGATVEADATAEADASEVTTASVQASEECLPPVMDDLLPRVLHCCYEDTWQVCM